MNTALSITDWIESLLGRIIETNQRVDKIETAIVSPQYLFNELNPILERLKHIEYRLDNPTDKSWNEKVIEMQRVNIKNLEHENDILRQRLQSYEERTVSSNMQPMQGCQL